jgi:hypothetical protein
VLSDLDLLSIVTGYTKQMSMTLCIRDETEQKAIMMTGEFVADYLKQWMKHQGWIPDKKQRSNHDAYFEAYYTTNQEQIIPVFIKMIQGVQMIRPADLWLNDKERESNDVKIQQHLIQTKTNIKQYLQMIDQCAQEHTWVNEYRSDIWLGVNLETILEIIKGKLTQFKSLYAADYVTDISSDLLFNLTPAEMDARYQAPSIHYGISRRLYKWEIPDGYNTLQHLLWIEVAKSIYHNMSSDLQQLLQSHSLDRSIKNESIYKRLFVYAQPFIPISKVTHLWDYAEGICLVKPDPNGIWTVNGLCPNILMPNFRVILLCNKKDSRFSPIANQHVVLSRFYKSWLLA